MYDEYVTLQKASQHVHHKGDWALALEINQGDEYRNASLGASFVARTAHTADAAKEPGVGASWETYWYPVAQGTQGVPGGSLLNKLGDYNAGTTYAADDGVQYGGRYFYSKHGSNTGNTPPSTNTSDSHWALMAGKGADGSADINGLTADASPAPTDYGIIYDVVDGINHKVLLSNWPGGGSASFWNTMPGSPTRINNTSFSITDTGNANSYDKLFKVGVILRWLDGSNFKTAMVVSSSYGTDTVTITIAGDVLAAGFTSMKYCLHMAKTFPLKVPLTLGTGTIVSPCLNTDCDIYPLAARVTVETPGVGGNTVFDVNAPGPVTMFTTKPYVTAGDYASSIFGVDAASTPIGAGGRISLDIDSVPATPPVDAVVDFYYYPVSWRYRS